uniref:Uncharacterized protein n=1 Tax=Heterorhabditis bacteriophora TaxID=37862 RepID=A0A1I7XK45_HETBA
MTKMAEGHWRNTMEYSTKESAGFIAPSR